MASVENKILRKRLLNAYLSSVLSISLVLLLVGTASLLLVNAGNVSAYFKESMQISITMKQGVSEDAARAFQEQIDAKQWSKSTEFISKEQGIEEMQSLLGEDFLSVFDTAPIPISLNLSLTADYVTPEKVDSLMLDIRKSDLVDDTVCQKSLIEKLNSNLRTISFVLSIMIAILLFISFALINNTIRLNLYSRRFNIHTMRLVGATKWFICKPFVAAAVFEGVISGMIAIILMLGALLIVKKEFIQLFTIFKLEQLLFVMGIVIASGVIICVLASLFVVNRMITLKKEELYY